MDAEPQTGLKINTLEYFSEVENVVDNITVKDLVTKLWRMTKTLSASSNIRDVIFLTQNLYTLGGLTVGSVNTIEAGPLKTLFDRVALKHFREMYPQNLAPKDTPIPISIVFSTPRFYLEPELDQKQIRIGTQVNGKSETLVMGYKEFFREMARVYRNRKLYENTTGHPLPTQGDL